MMSEVGPVFIRSCLAQANFECDDIVTIDRYEPDALAICTTYAGAKTPLVKRRT